MAIPGAVGNAGAVLGLDFGERRIGVALSDPERLLASGVLTVDRKKQPDFWKPLEEIITRKKVTAVVVGYPLRTDGLRKPGDKTEVVDVFANELKERFGLPVYFVDESYTSSMAADSLRGRHSAGGGRNKTPRDWARQKAEIDRVAACYILQDWLDTGETVK